MHAAGVLLLLLGGCRHGSSVISPLHKCCENGSAAPLPASDGDALSSPLHCAAYALDPEFQDHKFNPEVLRGLREACSMMLGDATGSKWMQYWGMPLTQGR